MKEITSAELENKAIQNAKVQPTCNSCMANRTRALKEMKSNLETLLSFLQAVNIPEQKCTLLQSIQNELRIHPNCKHLGDCQKDALEITQQIDKVLRYEATVASVVSALKNFLEKLEKLLVLETTKENDAKLAALLHDLAEHAPELRKIIDFDKYFG